MKLSQAARLRILYFLAFSCTAAWLPIFADYLKDAGISRFRTGIILSITPMMMLLVQPVFGIIADRVGNKTCLWLSSLLASASYFLYLFHGGFSYLFLVTIFMSVFYNAVQPLLDSISLSFTEKNPDFSYGTLRVAGAAGWACTGMIAGYYIDRIDTSVIFIFSSASMLLTFVLALTLPRSDKRSTPVVVSSSGHPLKEILQNRAVLLLLIAALLVYAASSPIYYFYSIYMKENGASSTLIGLAISFQGLCELPVFYFSARIISLLGIKGTMLTAVGATALRMTLYSLVTFPQASVAIELLHGIAWSLFWVACVEQVNRLVNENSRATGQSLLSAAMLGGGAIAGNLWTGYLYEAQIKVSEIYLLNAGIVTVIGILMFLFLAKSTGASKAGVTN